MQIQFLDAPSFSIDINGTLRRQGRWLLTADWFDSDINMLAEEWAGQVGDAWRTPSPDGRSYTTDETLKVTAINSRADDSRSCVVIFEAAAVSAAGSAIVPLDNSSTFKRCKDLTEYKSACFQLLGASENDLPRPGELIDWAGSDYRCESLESEHHDDGTVTVKICAVNTAVCAGGRITTLENSGNEKLKRGTWLVLPEALDDFLQTNALHTPALWAGENYYISQVATEPADSANRTCVTLTARYAQLKLLEVLRSEELLAIIDTDNPAKLLVWRSIWQAAREDQALFEAMLGTSAYEWTQDAKAIVCKVTPKRISDCEFEYTLEARYPESIGINYSHQYWKDRDIAERVEYYTRVGEMRFSPLQCGYTYRYNGVYTALNNWRAADQCPLDTANPLPVNWINQPLKLLEILEVSYLEGTSQSNIRTICSWFTGQRITSTSLAGVSGNFLRYDLEVDDMTDSRNRKWTRITKVYRKSPANYNWNAQYWV